MALAALLAAVLLAGLAPTAAGQGGGNRRGFVVFKAQTTDGESLHVDRFNTTDGGFVVFYEEAFLEGVIFDSYLGASEYMEPGLEQRFNVSLEDPLERSRGVVAVVHRDTNGNRSLDVVETEGREDTPYQGATGAVFDTAEVTVREPKPSPAAAAAALCAAAGAALARRCR